MLRPSPMPRDGTGKTSLKPTPKWVSKPIQIKECLSHLSKGVTEYKRLCELVPFEASCGSERLEPRNIPRPSPRQFDSTEIAGLGLSQSGIKPKPKPSTPKPSTSRQNPRPIPHSTRPRPTDYLSDAQKAFRDLGLTPTNSPSFSDETIKRLGLDLNLDLGMGRKVNDVQTNIQDLLAIDQEKEPVAINEEDVYKTYPENLNYRSVKIRKETTLRQSKWEDLSSYKYGHFIFMRPPVFNPNEEADLVPDVTVLVVVRVYWPFYLANTKRAQKNPKYSQEIVILGSQTLDRLRDMIRCITDVTVPGDLSVNPDSIPNHTAKDVYKSGFFFINGTFYNDFSHPDNVDYSEVIRKWAIEKRIGHFDQALMETTKVEDLTVQLGHPYVFMHQGCCEHLITISDIRLLQECESRSSASYPYVSTTSNDKIVFCFLCNRSPAKWLVEDNLRLPCTPCYFCEKCYHSFNYVNGEKVGQFKAYYFKEPIFIP